MPAGTNRGSRRRRPAALPAKYSNVGPAAIENRLRQRLAFVDVDERLMVRIVREHRRRDFSACPAAAGQFVPDLRSGSDCRSGRTSASAPTLAVNGPAVGGQCEPRPQQRDIAACASVDHVGFQKLFGRRDVEIVSDVEDVCDERHVDRAGLEPDVEVAERHGMRGDARRQTRRHDATPSARPGHERPCRCRTVDHDVVRPAAGSVPAVIHELGPGAFHLAGYLSIDRQRAIVEQCRALIDGDVPAYVPVVRGGGRMHVRMLCLGRHWNGKTYPYEPTRSDFDGQPVPPLARRVSPRWRGKWLPRSDMSVEADLCILNYYDADGRMGLHQDKDESARSLAAGVPVVSVSLGDTARFLFGGARRRDRLRRCGWSRATGSCSAAPRGCAVSRRLAHSARHAPAGLGSAAGSI